MRDANCMTILDAVTSFPTLTSEMTHSYQQQYPHFPFHHFFKIRDSSKAYGLRRGLLLNTYINYSTYFTLILLLTYDHD